MPEENVLSHKYLGALVVAAIVIIGLGLIVRNTLITPGSPQTAPPSEASALQRFSQENQLRGISSYIEGRVAAVAPLMVRVPAYDASGMRWGRTDSVITTSATRPVLVVPSPTPDTLRPPVAIDGDSVRRDWVIVVGRDAGERVISWHGISGGRAAARCGTHVIEKYVLGIPLTQDFAGAGVFDLTGRFRGMIIACPDGFAAIPGRELLRLLADTTTMIPDTAAGDSIGPDSLASDPAPAGRR